MGINVDMDTLNSYLSVETVESCICRDSKRQIYIIQFEKNYFISAEADYYMMPSIVAEALGMELNEYYRIMEQNGGEASDVYINTGAEELDYTEYLFFDRESAVRCAEELAERT